MHQFLNVFANKSSQNFHFHVHFPERRRGSRNIHFKLLLCCSFKKAVTMFAGSYVVKLIWCYIKRNWYFVISLIGIWLKYAGNIQHTAAIPRISLILKNCDQSWALLDLQVYPCVVYYSHFLFTATFKYLCISKFLSLQNINKSITNNSSIY